MTIETHDGRTQVTCDHCPTCYPNTYAREDFDVMIVDALTAGWRIVKAKIDPANGEGTVELFGTAPKVANRKPKQDFVHICPSCQQAAEHYCRGLL
ncbi:hypothetical protein [Nitratireductor sp.]|uniref:hypothetical protein n=1 Tax=Nitratireductor sp. TaxID=1872084 RepID=UPI002628EC9F|nr:hypothetical protein [Nitratireductor sp.]MCV0379030.1 hypothetical protein [Nitratireductor sp.]